MALNTNVWTVLTLVLVMYFVWMDVALYYRLQSDRNSLLVTQNYNILESAKNRNENDDSSPVHPLPERKKTGFDPFDPISVKLMTIDHLNHYVYYPLTGWLDEDILHVSEQWTLITPDLISYTHVLVALIAAKFLNSESLFRRRIGVLLFEVRSFLDSYDGYVARSRTHQRGMAQVWGSWGYYLDGICDLFGTSFFMFVVLLIMKRKNLPRKIIRLPKFAIPKVEDFSGWVALVRKSHKRSSISSEEDVENLLTSSPQRPLSPTTASTPCTPVTYAHGHVIIRQCWAIAFCMSLQQFLSSVFWNRYMQQYHTLLELPHLSVDSHLGMGDVQKFQTDTLQSAPFWIIVWSWRLLNPHAQMSFLLGAIFFDKSLEVFSWMQYLQFVPLGALIFTSEVHLQATAWKLPY